MDGYIIKPSDWDYIDTPYDTLCSYTSEDYGFSVFVSVERKEFSASKIVKVFGSCNSILDDNNCYYYDVSDSEFANRSWVDKFGYAEDMLNDDDDEVCVDIEIPYWFIDHACKMKEAESFYLDVFYNTFENCDGVSCNSLNGFVDIIENYLDNIKALYTEDMIDDIIHVANESGYIVRNGSAYCVNV